MKRLITYLHTCKSNLFIFCTYSTYVAPHDVIAQPDVHTNNITPLNSNINSNIANGVNRIPITTSILT